MVQSWPSVKIVHAKDVVEQPISGGAEMMVLPQTSGMALLRDTPAPIVAKDVDGGRERGLPVHETVWLRNKTMGKGAGESWHTHFSYYDIFFYITGGKGTMWWIQDGVELKEDFGPGDFVHMSPGSRHQWLNTGDEDLKMVEFGHFHNYE